MALVVPKIVYPAGGPNVLVFQLPPRFVPYRDYAVVRHDNIASSGAVERIFERFDAFTTFTMEYVRIGADIQAWDAFIITSLQGVPFDFYPDSTSPDFTTCLLEATTWTPAYKQLGMYTFQCKFRHRISWP